MAKGQQMSEKQALLAEYYVNDVDTHGNAYKSGLKAGYAETVARYRCATFVKQNPVKAAIERLQARNKAKSKYTIEQATEELRAKMAPLDKAAAKGNFTAIAKQLDFLKEIFEINGLHKIRTVDETPDQAQLDQHQAQEAEAAASIRLDQVLAEMHRKGTQAAQEEQTA